MEQIPAYKQGPRPSPHILRTSVFPLTLTKARTASCAVIADARHALTSNSDPSPLLLQKCRSCAAHVDGRGTEQGPLKPKGARCSGYTWLEDLAVACMGGAPVKPHNPIHCFGSIIAARFVGHELAP